MVTDKIKELIKLKAAAAKLEASVIAQRSAELGTLPAAYGYDSLPAFIHALKEAATHQHKAAEPKAAKPKKHKQKRARITPEIKAQVKAMTEGGETGSAIARATGISHASVQNVRKELGLVKPREGAAEAPPVATE
jgi:hypothetical protein